MAIPPINLTDPFTTLVTRTNEVITATNNSDSSVGSGGLASLTTDDKSSLVAAINEIVAFTYDSDFARGSSTLRTAIFSLVDSSYLKEDQINTTYLQSEIDETYLQSQIDSTYLKGQIDETYLQSQIDSTYLQSQIDSTYLKGQIDETYLQSQIDETYLQSQIDSTYLKGQIDSNYLRTEILDSGFIASIPGLPTLGSFALEELDGVLYFKYNGTNIASIDSAGTFISANNITAFGTP